MTSLWTRKFSVSLSIVMKKREPRPNYGKEGGEANERSGTDGSKEKKEEAMEGGVELAGKQKRYLDLIYTPDPLLRS